MSDPKNARKTKAGRLYEWRPQGAAATEIERYYSVTTLIGGGIPKPALQAWGMKAVAEFAVANHKTLATMLNGLTLSKDTKGYLVSDPGAIQGAVEWLKGAPYRERDRKADLGTLVHQHAEAYQKRRPYPPATGDASPYVESFQKFLSDWKPRYELAEASVYNRTYRYAGTLDAIADLDGMGVGPTRLILDYKTTGSGVYPEAALQLAAYRNAEFIGMADGTEAEMPEVAGAGVVWLRPDGYDLIPVETGEETFKYFKHAIEIFRWQEEIARGVIGQPIPRPKESVSRATD